jgi:hypothetical protein
VSKLPAAVPPSPASRKTSLNLSRVSRSTSENQVSSLFLGLEEEGALACWLGWCGVRVVLEPSSHFSEAQLTLGGEQRGKNYREAGQSPNVSL